MRVCLYCWISQLTVRTFTSADLWVAGDVPGSNSTTHNATINYNDGSVSGQSRPYKCECRRETDGSVGRIQTATLGIEGYTISNQAYSE